MICRKLRLEPGETLLDIGCGWGGLVCHAAQHYGVRAHGVTLAQEQYDYAKAKVARLGLQDRVTFELQRLFAARRPASTRSPRSACSSTSASPTTRPIFRPSIGCCRPRGFICTTPSRGRAKRDDTACRRKYRPEAAALMRYIFPGGEVDHLGMSVANLERYGFEVHDVEAWREHYARTTPALA